MVNDNVMGGVSDSEIGWNDEGWIFWTGEIKKVPGLGSAGFVTVKHMLKEKVPANSTRFKLHVFNNMNDNRKVVVRLITNQYGRWCPAIRTRLPRTTEKPKTIGLSDLRLYWRGNWKKGGLPSPIKTQDIKGYSLVLNKPEGEFSVVIG